MAAITTDHLLRTEQSNTIGVVYILCNYKAHANQSTISLLAAILKQLVQALPSVAEPTARLYDSYTNRMTRPSLEEIFHALQSVLNHYSSVYVIDALDECSDKDSTHSQLLAKLHDLQCKTDLRLMVTSCFIPDIVVEFRLMSMLEVRASDADVEQFVGAQMYRLPKCVQRDDEPQGFVQDKIVEAVEGMSYFASMLSLPTHDSIKFLLARLAS